MKYKQRTVKPQFQKCRVQDCEVIMHPDIMIYHLENIHGIKNYTTIEHKHLISSYVRYSKGYPTYVRRNRTCVICGVKMTTKEYVKQETTTS